jgi:hypothetical protein
MSDFSEPVAVATEAEVTAVRNAIRELCAVAVEAADLMPPLLVTMIGRA